MKRGLIIIALLISNLGLQAQYKSFANEEEKISAWLITQTNVSNQAKKVKKSTISFKSHGYSIEGCFSKGILASDQNVTIYNTENNPVEILNGKVSYIANTLVVTGVWYKDLSPDGTILYGSFFVSNTPGNGMIYKDKKADKLNISPKNVVFYRGKYDDYTTAILEFGESSYIHLSGKSSYAYGKVSVLETPDKDFYDFDKYLMTLKDDYYHDNLNGEIFKGNVHPVKNEDGKILLYKREGTISLFTNGDNFEGNQQVLIKEPYVIFKATGVYAGDNWNEVEYSTLKTSDFQWDSCWINKYYYDHCDQVKINFKDGDVFSGKAKILSSTSEDGNQTSITLLYENGLYENHNGGSFKGEFVNGLPAKGLETYPNGDKFDGTFKDGARSQGTYTYQNGDKFEGKFAKGVYGNIFTDGTTYFTDGTKTKGVWFGTYNLTEQQYYKIYEAINPTEARKLAEKYSYANTHITYISGEINNLTYFFNPRSGMRELVGIRTINYDKAKNLYECFDHEGKRVLDLIVDNKGRHIREILYTQGEPIYINLITWYSNGSVESIKTYHYDTQLLYISSNFFSDGIIRSAYEYGTGNNGKTIVIKSKESHPTMGGYTSKLYDLNGNYERSIEWEFGESGLLFTTPKKLVLEPLDLSEYKIVEPE